MKIIRPSVEYQELIAPEEIMRLIERAGRVCYKSESKISEGSAEKFIRNIVGSGHESVVEHVSLTFKIICDRGVTHEIVRHRIASYSQESTRYCNYSKDKFGNEITVVKPCFMEEGDPKYEIWVRAMEEIERNYFAMLSAGATAQEARSLLPNSLKTEIFATMNIREWRHFLKLRTAKAAHPQMREVALMIYDVLKEKLPALFSDIIIEE